MPVANRDGEATSGPPHGDSPHFTVHRGLYSLPVGIELPFLQIQRFIPPQSLDSHPPQGVFQDPLRSILNLKRREIDFETMHGQRRLSVFQPALNPPQTSTGLGGATTRRITLDPIKVRVRVKVRVKVKLPV